MSLQFRPLLHTLTLKVCGSQNAAIACCDCQLGSRSSAMFHIPLGCCFGLGPTQYDQLPPSSRHSGSSPTQLGYAPQAVERRFGPGQLSRLSPRGLSGWLVPVRVGGPTNRVIIINRNSCASVFHVPCVIGSLLIWHVYNTESLLLRHAALWVGAWRCVHSCISQLGSRPSAMFHTPSVAVLGWVSLNMTSYHRAVVVLG